MTRWSARWSVVLPAVFVIAAGCHGNKQPDKSDFKSPIDAYYSARTTCVWASAVKFPAQADASNEDQTKGFDALTDAGLLTRKAEEKKRFLIGSKQVTDYDLSDQGRSAWTADQSQPGYGNFCFGHRQVTSIDSFSTAVNPSGANTATVNYHYDMTGVPDWAKSQEMQTAFPNLHTALAGPRAATATLTQTQNGWQLIQPQTSPQS